MASEILKEQLEVPLLTADTAGRALVASDFFGSTELDSKFASGYKPGVSPGTQMQNRLHITVVPATGDFLPIGAAIYVAANP